MDLRIWWQKVVSFPPPKMCLRKFEYKKYFKISLLPLTKKVSLNNFVTKVNNKPDVFIIVVTQKLVFQQSKTVTTKCTEIPLPPPCILHSFVLMNISPKLTFVQSIISSIDMTPQMRKIKNRFFKVCAKICAKFLLKFFCNLLAFVMGFPKSYKILKSKDWN